MKYVDVLCRCLVIALFAEMLRDAWTSIQVIGFLAQNLTMGGLFYGLCWLIAYPIRQRLNKGRVPRDAMPEPVLIATSARKVLHSPPVTRGSYRGGRHH